MRRIAACKECQAEGDHEESPEVCPGFHAASLRTVICGSTAASLISFPEAASAGHVLQLCVMSQRPKPERVGIRELRQNLSVYVKRIREEGRSYEVTERGEPVARLTPLEGQATSRIQQMIAQGRITPASRKWEDIPPPIVLPAGRPVSEILLEMRDEDER